MIVSNTSPLIALAKIDRLDLVAALFGEARIPPSVRRELLGKSGPESARLDQALETWLTVADRPELPPEAEAALQVLDAGERDAVALAYALRQPLIIDDRLGRQAARRLGVTLTGTVGVICAAKLAGLVPSARTLLDALRAQGYWLSDELLEAAARLAEE